MTKLKFYDIIYIQNEKGKRFKSLAVIVMTQKAITDMMRAQFTADLAKFLEQKYGCDVCKTAAGTLMIPCVDSEGADRWLKYSVIVPKDATEEDGTDGYSLAQEYNLKVAAAEQRKKDAAAKAAAAKAKKEAKADARKEEAGE